MHNVQALISIVIPVYKVEAYLERCIRSVLAQTYQNLEIILVDDGSPDNCGEICEQYATQDSRISVYHKENGGLSDARNYGTKKATGDYVAYVDSDDYIAPDYIAYLYGLIRTYNADISCCCMTMTSKDSAEFRTHTKLPLEQVFSGREACSKLLSDPHVMYMVLVTAWGKLYSSEIAKKHPFPVGKYHEDEATTCKFYYESKGVVVGNRCLYAYYQNPNGIMNSRGKALNMDMIWALSHRASFFAQNGETNLEQLAWSLLLSYLIEDSAYNSGRCNELIRNFPENKNILKKDKLKVDFYNAAPFIYKLFYRSKRMLGKTVRRLIKS